MMSNANSATLKSALQNYIKAVNELNNNARTENKLISMMNNTRVGLTNSYKKRIANAIASIVAKAPRVAVKAAEAAAGAAPEMPAAAAVNNLTTRIKNLNNFMNSVKGGNANAFFKAHKNAGRNVNRNINTNSKRNGGARYANVLRNVKSRYSLGTAAEVSQVPVGPYGIGKLTGVTMMPPANNNTPSKYRNYDYIKSSIVNSPNYANNAAKIAAVLAFNPTLNWGQLKITARTRQNANMLRILNAVERAPKPAPAAAAVNIAPNTGEALQTMFANRANLNKLIANTTPNALKNKAATPASANNLHNRIIAAANASGVSPNNRNLRAALSRLAAHTNALSSFEKVMANTNNSKLKANVTTKNQANALMARLNAAAAAVGKNSNASVKNAKLRITAHKSTLNASPAP
jgi:hypothetical protein